MTKHGYPLQVLSLAGFSAVVALTVCFGRWSALRRSSDCYAFWHSSGKRRHLRRCRRISVVWRNHSISRCGKPFSRALALGRFWQFPVAICTARIPNNSRPSAELLLRDFRTTAGRYRRSLRFLRSVSPFMAISGVFHTARSVLPAIETAIGLRPERHSHCACLFQSCRWLFASCSASTYNPCPIEYERLAHQLSHRPIRRALQIGDLALSCDRPLPQCICRWCSCCV